MESLPPRGIVHWHAACGPLKNGFPGRNYAEEAVGQRQGGAAGRGISGQLLNFLKAFPKPHNEAVEALPEFEAHSVEETACDFQGADFVEGSL